MGFGRPHNGLSSCDSETRRTRPAGFRWRISPVVPLILPELPGLAGQIAAVANARAYGRAAPGQALAGQARPKPFFSNVSHEFRTLNTNARPMEELPCTILTAPPRPQVA